MKIRNNLRLRFIVSFCLFALLLAAVFAIIILEQERSLADEFFQRRIQSELEYFADRYRLNPQTPLPVAEDIQSYLGTDKMPGYIKQTVENLPDGVYERDIDADEFFDRVQNRTSRRQRIREPHDLYFGVKTLSGKQKVYIFIDFEFWHQKERELRAHSFWSFIAATFIAIFLGLITANRVINPLKRLMEVVNNSDPDNIPTGFSQVFKNDEFGALAKSFESLLIRVKKFIKREHQFTRDASHELRTPVTVIKGAVELLKMTPACEETMVDKLVKRIERSTLDMETTIESLLWLAREAETKESGPNAELLPLVQNAMEQNRHLISGKAVEFDLQVNATPVVSAPAGVLSIAISNLIRNACQFTIQGKIVVSLNQNSVEVSDTGVGIGEEILKDITKPSVSSPKSNGFGFGLDIVSRLCSRFGWQLTIESTPGQGTKTCLIFRQD